MERTSRFRRRLIKAGLSLPLFGALPWRSRAAITDNDIFPLPNDMYHKLYALYGPWADDVRATDRLELRVPEIAENGAVVPVSIRGETGLVSSLAFFSSVSTASYVCVCRLNEMSDLPVSTRIRLNKTGDVYAIARTPNGLLGVKREVKITIGCGGG